MISFVFAHQVFSIFLRPKISQRLISKEIIEGRCKSRLFRGYLQKELLGPIEPTDVRAGYLGDIYRNRLCAMTIIFHFFWIFKIQNPSTHLLIDPSTFYFSIYLFIPIVIKTCAIVISTEGRIVSGRSGEIC